MTLAGQVLYEMHIGTFTREGTWAAATRELPGWSSWASPSLEVMPVAEFAGAFGWGYDGVDLFAPTRLYGTPDDFRALRRSRPRAGPRGDPRRRLQPLRAGRQLPRAFSDDYFTDRAQTDWGDALNFDGPDAGPVREFFLANAGYWIDEFHFDGLRLDATQAIHDDSPEHILAGDRPRGPRGGAAGASILIFAENEPQNVRQVRPPRARAATGSTRSGTTTSTTARGRADGPRRGLLHRLHGHAAGVDLGREVGLPVPGTAVQWQEKRRGTPTFGVPPAAVRDLS